MRCSRVNASGWRCRSKVLKGRCRCALHAVSIGEPKRVIEVMPVHVPEQAPVETPAPAEPEKVDA